MLRVFLALVLAAATGCVDAATSDDPARDSTDAGGHSGHDAGTGKTDGGTAGTPQVDAGDAGAGGGTTAPDDQPTQAGTAGSGTNPGTAGDGGAAAGSGGSAGMGVDLSAAFYDQDNLPQIYIDLPAESRAALGTDPNTYVRGTVRYGDQTFPNVGVRIKGEASLRTLAQKAAFKLKFDNFVTDQTFLGMRRVTLNNMVQDSSFMSERLSYAVFKAAGLPAPRCNSALVYVDNVFYGVYTNIEAEDKTFLSRWFKSNAGNLYEDGQVDFKAGSESAFELQTNETANDRTDLTKLISALGSASGDNYLTTLDATLDTDHYLHFAALEGLVNQWDGYSYTYMEPNNFRIYDDPTSGKFTFLPWGMDMSMKASPYAGGKRSQLPLFSVPRWVDDADPNVQRDAGGLFLTKCLSSSTCKTRYAEVVRELLPVYEALNIEALAAHHYAQIKDYIYEETRAETSPQAFETSYQTLLSVVRARAAAVRSDLSAAGL